MNINQYIDGMKDELIKALQTCIQFKSVKDLDSASSGAPFGQGVKECLEWTLGLGQKFGFEVKNVDGYAGHIEMGTGGTSRHSWSFRCCPRGGWLDSSSL